MTDTRERIRAHVGERPGIHFNALVRETGFAPGQLQYHLRRLLREDEVTVERLYGRSHYYSPEYDAWERGALALFRRETAREAMFVLLERESARPERVADALGVARSTLEWHLDHLAEQDLVEKRTDERGQVLLRLTHPERTARLLRRTSPSFPDRLVDRFIRLVDALLEESGGARD
ncbi:winged helix-turn-helix transcriptional regulator [Natronorarus salvus]|uniref:winged helix-turn-helix transcriptional regulator n=1 Tax=Natronorarus salvus TaxID=3117733 RepID=UPI002F262423